MIPVGYFPDVTAQMWWSELVHQVAAFLALALAVVAFLRYAPQLLPDVGEAQPEYPGCDCEDCWWESVPREHREGLARLARGIDWVMWEDELRWPETEEST